MNKKVKPLIKDKNS